MRYETMTVVEYSVTNVRRQTFSKSKKYIGTFYIADLHTDLSELFFTKKPWCSHRFGGAQFCTRDVNAVLYMTSKDFCPLPSCQNGRPLVRTLSS
jgi:hypothetical protein